MTKRDFLLSIIISSCSLGKPELQSINLSHGVTFDVNTSFIEVTKTHTSYLKNKKEKGSLTGKEGQDSRYVEQFYQVWDEYFWMTPEKGQSITPTAICWELKNKG